MFVPVRIGVGAGEHGHSAYDRKLELTARQLAAFEARAGNMLEPLSAIGRDLHTSVAAQFATEGSGATGRWKALSPAYGDWKQSKRPGVPILVGLRPTGAKGQRPQSYTASGRMRMSLLDPLAMHVTARRLLYAPTSDYAGFHETGTSKMPARPPVDLTLTFLHSVDRAFVGWLAKVMREEEL